MIIFVEFTLFNTIGLFSCLYAYLRKNVSLTLGNPLGLIKQA